MKKIFLFAVLVGMSSCFSMKREDYSLYESFQINNSSAQEVTLHFYKKGEPMTVYYEVCDQMLAYVDGDNCSREQSTLLRDSVITLPSGRTILFYAYEQKWNPNNFATSLRYCGSSDSQLFLFANRTAFLGDSVNIALPNTVPQVLPIEKNEQWETWYDEKKFIYLHLWRIE